MSAIRPVSDLQSYDEVLSDVHEGSPVLLAKNGHVRYAILDMRDYERLSSAATLLSELEAGRLSGEREGWISSAEVKARFTS